LVAVKQTHYAYSYASPSMQEDREIVLARLQHGDRLQGDLAWLPSSILEKDREVAITALKYVGNAYYNEDIPSSLRHDKAIACEVVKNNPSLFFHLPPVLKNDKAVILQTLVQDSSSMISFFNSYRSDLGPFHFNIGKEHLDKEVILTIVKKDRELMSRIIGWRNTDVLRTDLDINIGLASAERLAGLNITSPLSKESVIEAMKDQASSNTDTNAVIVASRMGLVWEYGMKELVDENPRSVIVQDRPTGLYPFMIAALSCHEYAWPDLETVYEMLKSCPEVVSTVFTKYSPLNNSA